MLVLKETPFRVIWTKVARNQLTSNKLTKNLMLDFNKNEKEWSDILKVKNNN